MKLLILGAGGHGKVVKEVAEAIRTSTGEAVYERIDFLDDTVSESVGRISELEIKASEYDALFCAIGNNLMRKELLEQAEKTGKKIPVLVHPTAYVSPTAVVGEGTVVEPKAIINTHAVVEKGCIVSVGAIIDHDAVVRQYSHVNAGAICKAGSVLERGRKLEIGEVVSGY